ncbi:MAG: hypothetical protein RLY49_539 [Candidatus Parcubacteria bacterium]|jgi:GTPase SAR1 family protein
MRNITSITLIIVSIGVFLFFIDPQYKNVKELRAEITKNNEIIDLANKLDLKKNELNDKYNQISPTDKESLEKLLPDTVDNVRLIIDINNIAEKFGIVIRDISINSRESSAGEPKKVVTQKSNFEGVLEENSIKYVDTSKIGVISFSFSVSAKYEVFLEFLKYLEESLRLVDIRNIEISRGSGSGVFYDYRVTLDTYWLK